MTRSAIADRITTMLLFFNSSVEALCPLTSASVLFILIEGIEVVQGGVVKWWKGLWCDISGGPLVSSSWISWWVVEWCLIPGLDVSDDLARCEGLFLWHIMRRDCLWCDSSGHRCQSGELQLVSRWVDQRWFVNIRFGGTLIYPCWWWIAMVAMLVKRSQV